MPSFAIEMARYRIGRRHYDRVVSQAELFAPDAAVETGLLDRAVEPAELLAVARDAATRLAKLSPQAFAATKRRTHADAARAIRASLGELRPGT